MNAEEFVRPALKATGTFRAAQEGRYLPADCAWRRCEIPNFKRIFPRKRRKKKGENLDITTSHYDNSAFVALLGKHWEIRSHTLHPRFPACRADVSAVLDQACAAAGSPSGFWALSHVGVNSLASVPGGEWMTRGRVAHPRRCLSGDVPPFCVFALTGATLGC